MHHVEILGPFGFVAQSTVDPFSHASSPQVDAICILGTPGKNSDPRCLLQPCYFRPAWQESLYRSQIPGILPTTPLGLPHNSFRTALNWSVHSFLEGLKKDNPGSLMVITDIFQEEQKPRKEKDP